MDTPSMIRGHYIAIVSLFAALAVASNYAMLPLYQVKLMDSLVFIAAYLYGWRAGAGVAAITWMVYGSLNPLGAAGFPLLLILIIGEMVFAVAGSLLSNLWNRSLDFRVGKRYITRGLLLGVTGLLSAFIYDIWTNAIDGLLIYRSVEGIFIRITTGALFMIVHETSDLLLFIFAVPALIVAISRLTQPAERRLPF
jgi:hypothetical protein